MWNIQMALQRLHCRWCCRTPVQRDKDEAKTKETRQKERQMKLSVGDSSSCSCVLLETRELLQPCLFLVDCFCCFCCLTWIALALQLFQICTPNEKKKKNQQGANEWCCSCVVLDLGCGDAKWAALSRTRAHMNRVN